MQISALTKLMHPIKRLLSLRQKNSSEETSEQREESEMQDEVSKMQTCRGEHCSPAKASPLRRGGSETDGEVAEDVSLSPADAGVIPEGEPTEEPTAHAVNTTAHLSSSVPRAAKLPQGVLTKGEMAEIRSIFGDIDDAEIQRLYKRVTK